MQQLVEVELPFIGAATRIGAVTHDWTTSTTRRSHHREQRDKLYIYIARCRSMDGTKVAFPGLAGPQAPVQRAPRGRRSSRRVLPPPLSTYSCTNPFQFANTRVHPQLGRNYHIIRATPLLRVKAKITVKNVVYVRVFGDSIRSFDCDFGLALKSGVALNGGRSVDFQGVWRSTM